MNSSILILSILFALFQLSNALPKPSVASSYSSVFDSNFHNTLTPMSSCKQHDEKSIRACIAELQNVQNEYNYVVESLLLSESEESEEPEEHEDFYFDDIYRTSSKPSISSQERRTRFLTEEKKDAEQARAIRQHQLEMKNKRKNLKHILKNLLNVVHKKDELLEYEKTMYQRKHDAAVTEGTKAN